MGRPAECKNFGVCSEQNRGPLRGSEREVTGSDLGSERICLAAVWESIASTV